ncbi:hypothetical protein [Pseudoxanthomonas putridarboris]|uniref:Exosortase A system-associated hydrolase 2 n=1 Tax=Pseudoxanthomonas putridarboris TaxID=752605 RepID=A0ABU9IZC7_9GAMM
MVQPLYFGPPQRTLLGMRHGPGNGADAARAVTVAPPLLQEGIATQRALWWLCEQLAGAGVSSLRFDWYGSGDSGGASQQMTLEGLAQDAAAAAGWWNGRTPHRVRQLGLRSGAFGLLLAASHSAEPVDLVLWDPILSGAALLAEWKRMHQAQLTGVGRYPFSTTGPGEDDLLGFDPDAAFLRALHDCDLHDASLPAGSRVLVTGWEPGEGMQAWIDRLARSGVRAEWWPLDTGDAPAWDDPMQFENQLFPRRAAARLAARLAEVGEWA